MEGGRRRCSEASALVTSLYMRIKINCRLGENGGYRTNVGNRERAVGDHFIGWVGLGRNTETTLLK